MLIASLLLSGRSRPISHCVRQPRSLVLLWILETMPVASFYDGSFFLKGLHTVACAMPRSLSLPKPLIAGSGDQSGKRFERLFEALLGQNGKICKLPFDLDSGLGLAGDLLRQHRDVAILACGGDGTVTWILSELNARRETAFKDIRLPPVGIIPLGTGNDLARSLGWGPALTDNFQLLSYVQRALRAETVLLDQWQLTLRPTHLLPPSLRQRGTVEFVGYFTNYFSVGMDAHTAYEVGRVRSSALGKCCFRTRCCPPCRFLHGGLLCYALNGPNCARCLCCRTRALNEDLEVKFDDDPGTITFPTSIRQFTLTNLNSYGATAA